MIFSRSTEYAIRALVHLAQLPEGQNKMVKQVAQEEQIPAHYLAKIMQQLARKHVLASMKGPAGGFRLRRTADDISLLALVLDGELVFPAFISDRLKSEIHDYLSLTTIQDLVDALKAKAETAKNRRAA